MRHETDASFLSFQEFPDGRPVALFSSVSAVMEELMASPMVQQITFSPEAAMEWPEMIQLWANHVPIEEVIALQNEIANRYPQTQ
jgi:hypothetical protein